MRRKPQNGIGGISWEGLIYRYTEEVITSFYLKVGLLFDFFPSASRSQTILMYSVTTAVYSKSRHKLMGPMSVIMGGWWEKGSREEGVFSSGADCGLTAHTPRAQKLLQECLSPSAFMGVITMPSTQGMFNCRTFLFFFLQTINCVTVYRWALSASECPPKIYHYSFYMSIFTSLYSIY